MHSFVLNKVMFITNSLSSRIIYFNEQVLIVVPGVFMELCSTLSLIKKNNNNNIPLKYNMLNIKMFTTTYTIKLCKKLTNNFDTKKLAKGVHKMCVLLSCFLYLSCHHIKCLIQLITYKTQLLLNLDVWFDIA